MRVFCTTFALAVAIGFFATPARVAADEKAVCVVCKVTEGSNEAEEVVAVRMYAGARYPLCSEACAEKFDADPAAYVPPVFPRPAPALSASDLNGKSLRWDDFKAKVVLLDFWATWCGPCRKAMPELQALHDRYAGRGFSVLGVSIDENGLKKVQRFVAEKKITYPIGLDDDQDPTWNRFRVKAIPAAFLVDGKGQIVAQWTGSSVDLRELETKLAAMLKRD